MVFVPHYRCPKRKLLYQTCAVVVVIVTFHLSRSYRLTTKDVAAKGCDEIYNLNIVSGHSRDSHLQYMSLAMKTLRKQLFRAVCERSSQVSDTGTWCLVSRNKEDAGYTYYASEAGGYAMTKYHFLADKGVARTIASIMKPGQQLVDLGCGIGQYGHFFRENNATFKWRGYDGAINVEEYTHGFVDWVDLTVPGFSSDGDTPQWVMALEIGEHVPAQFQQIVIDNIDRNNQCGAIVSWAVPGQGGHSHVNERSNEWVIDQFNQRGYFYDDEETRRGRELSQYSWFKNTLMIFRRQKPGTC